MIKVHCPGCQKKYAIPEEKLPMDKEIDLPCPACKTIIKLKKNAPQEPVVSGFDSQAGDALMKKIIKNSRALPPMPQIIIKANEVLSSDKAGFKEVGDVLATDQAMATRVLKLANSAYYGLTVPVSSVQQASALLGFQALLELITVVSTSKMMGKALTGYAIDARDMWEHSLSVAIGAKLIAEKKFPALVNDAFNAGLIHDSGMLILDDYVAEEKATFEDAMDKKKTIQEAETLLFGFDHGIIASEFFKKWKLPPCQTHAIRYHHKPSQSGGDPLSRVLHAADALANENKTEQNFANEQNAIDFVGFSDDEWAAIGLEVTESVNHIMATMS
ncbi:MAG: zinc-ribbon domain-containing protein [Proteobacteria bacterium]|nr:zinc-ribbon domain-containing protein [Pseudomonadota bacterium]